LLGLHSRLLGLWDGALNLRDHVMRVRWAGHFRLWGSWDGASDGDRLLGDGGVHAGGLLPVDVPGGDPDHTPHPSERGRLRLQRQDAGAAPVHDSSPLASGDALQPVEDTWRRRSGVRGERGEQGSWLWLEEEARRGEGGVRKEGQRRGWGGREWN
jgi:hypothetical protein